MRRLEVDRASRSWSGRPAGEAALAHRWRRSARSGIACECPSLRLRSRSRPRWRCCSRRAPASQAPKFSTATNSSPIVLSRDGKLALGRQPGRRQRLGDQHREQPGPRRRSRSATSPRASRSTRPTSYAYVANAADGTVTVIRITQREPEPASRRASRRTSATTARSSPAPSRGTSSSSPDGRRIFVANSRPGHDHGHRRDDAKSRRGQAARSPEVIGHVELRGSAAAPTAELPLPAARPGGDARTASSSSSPASSPSSARASSRSTTRAGRASSAASNINTDSTQDQQATSRLGRIGDRCRATPASPSTRPATARPTRPSPGRTSCRAS